MKKLTMALALVLCLVLCVFAFASCGKKNKTTSTTAPDATTPAGSTAESTTATPTTAPATEPPHVHVPEDDYQIDVEPTCLTPGEMSLYCVECGALIEGSTEVLPADPNAHVVETWDVVEPTLLDPVGSKTGVCQICEQNVEIVLNWELDPFSSIDRTGKWADQNDFRMHKSIADIRGDKSFAPTEDDPDGNDLWFEYSLLYNKTLYDHDYPGSLSEIRIFCFRESTNRSTYRGFYYLYLRNNGDGFKTSTDCPFRGHIDYSTYDTTATPPENCAYDLSELGNTLNGRLIGRYKAGWDPKRTESPYLWDAEWQTMGGWHRLGFRYHQEANIVEGEVVYSGYTELYIDGVLCWKIDSNFKPGHKDSLVTKNLLLWTATIDEEDPTKLVYTNHDSMMVEMRLDSVGNSSKEVLIAVDDVRWTCGDGFAVPVVRVENPKPVTIELKPGLYDDGAMYYAKPDCVHEAEEEWTILEPATLLEAGVKAKFCAKCGEQMEVAAAEYEPYVISSSMSALERADWNEANGVDWLNPSESDFLNGVLIKKNINKLKDEDEHYYPTDENPLGNDLLVEVSLLWNDTLKTGYSGEPLTFAHVDGYDVFHVKANLDAKERDGFTYTYITPTPAAIEADATVKKPALGEFGWHRLGFRVHQEAEIEEGAVKYTYIASAYVDGTLVLSYDATDYVVRRNTSSTVTALLYTAEINEEDPTKLDYFDIGKDSKSNYQTSYAILMFEVFFNKAGAYAVLGDIYMTCGQEFVQQVVAVADPVEATFEAAEGVNMPAKMWYKAAE